MTVRVGVLGVGSIGTTHARNLSHHVAGASVSIVFDADQQRANAIGAELGVLVATSAEALIAHPDVDSVVIASPDELHAEQALACIAAGKPALCEKPLTPRPADALAIMAAEITLGRRLVTMGFMRRFDPGYVELKSRLDSGEVGAPLVVHCVHRSPSLGQENKGAMLLTNSVVHEIDINRWLLGEEYVSAQVITGGSSAPGDDELIGPVLVFLQTSSGVVVEIEAMVNSRYGYDVRCEVVASEGALALGDGSRSRRGGAHHRGDVNSEQWLDRFADAYRLELQGWVDWVAEGVVRGASVWDGYAATAVAHACVAALSTDRPVPVSLAPPPALYTGS